MTPFQQLWKRWVELTAREGNLPPVPALTAIVDQAKALAQEENADEVSALFALMVATARQLKQLVDEGRKHDDPIVVAFVGLYTDVIVWFDRAGGPQGPR